MRQNKSKTASARQRRNVIRLFEKLLRQETLNSLGGRKPMYQRSELPRLASKTIPKVLQGMLNNGKPTDCVCLFHDILELNFAYGPKR